MIDNLVIPNRGGCFIDAYNQSINEEIAGTITTRVDASNMSFVTEPKIIERDTDRVIQVGNIVDDTDRDFKNPQTGRIYAPEGLSPTINTCQGGGREPKIIERDTPMKGNYTEPRICTMVGRDPNNPSSRARSDHYEQFLEMGDDVSNTLTSVQKDNLLAEPIIIDDYNQRVPQDQDVIGTVPTQFGNPAPRHGYKIAEHLRIPQATKQGYIEVPQGAVFDMSYPESTTRRGRVQEGGQVSPTLMAGGEAPCYFEGIKEVENETKRLFEGDNQSRPREILLLLRKETNKETYKWAIGRLKCILEKEILQSGLHEEVFYKEREYQSGLFTGSPHIEEDCLFDTRKANGVRNMRLNEEYRCTPQGWKLSEQFTIEFNDIMQKLSHENASTQSIMSDLWKSCEVPWVLQQALFEVEKIWQSINSERQVSYRIRKLTPREVFRLMGVTEADIDKIQQSGVSQSQQYKMAGNSIVVDVLEHIFRKMFVDTGQESQQLSLF